MMWYYRIQITQHCLNVLPLILSLLALICMHVPLSLKEEVVLR